MMKVDLITGFLGAGKTTFLQFYEAYLHRLGLKTHVIENEFACIGIDAEILKAEGGSVSNLSGVCMCCGGTDRFREMLWEAASAGVDRVLVEPSGIFEVSEFFRLLKTDRLEGLCEAGNIITIVDPAAAQYEEPEIRHMMALQIEAAGAVLFSKARNLPAETLENQRILLDALLTEQGFPEGLAEDNPRLLICDWKHMNDEKFAWILGCGFRKPEHSAPRVIHSELFSSMVLVAGRESVSRMEKKLEACFREPGLGQVMRIKGFAQNGEGDWFLVNCTPDRILVKPVRVTRGVLVLIGRELNERKLWEFFG